MEKIFYSDEEEEKKKIKDRGSDENNRGSEKWDWIIKTNTFKESKDITK